MITSRHVAADLAVIAVVVAVATVSAMIDGWLAMLLLTSAALAPIAWALRPSSSKFVPARPGPAIRVEIAPRVAPPLPAPTRAVPLQLVAPVSPPFAPAESRLH